MYVLGKEWAVCCGVIVEVRGQLQKVNSLPLPEDWFWELNSGH